MLIISCRASFRTRDIPLLSNNNSNSLVSTRQLKYNSWIKTIKINTKGATTVRAHPWLKISIEDSRDSNSSRPVITWKQTISTIRILTPAATPLCTSLIDKWLIRSTPSTIIQASSKCKSNSRCSRELSHLLRVKVACTDSSNSNSNTAMRAEELHLMMNNKYIILARICRMKESLEFSMETIARIRFSPDNSIFNDLLNILSP